MRWFGRRESDGAVHVAAPADVTHEAVAEGGLRDADFVTDAPITEPEEDRFGRHAWARRVAHTIAAQDDPASLVVGIYGPWGDGKTSDLNLISDSLDQTQNVVPV